MLIYLSTFFASFCFEEFSNKVRKNFSYIISFIGLLFPIFLAGLRSVGVGTDTKGYVSFLFEIADKSSSFNEYLNSFVYTNFQLKSVKNWEFGYNLLIYITAKLSSSIQFTFFVTQFIIIVFVYFGIKLIEGVFSRSFSLLLFYLLFYGTTLNLMRQWIAISIIFYGFHFLQKRKPVFYILTCILAIMFHNSAIIGFILLPIYYYYYNNNKLVIERNLPNKHNDQRFFYFTLCIIVIFFLFDSISYFISNFSPAFNRYYYVYLDGTLSFSLNQFIRKLPVIICLIFTSLFIKHAKDIYFYLSMFVFDIFFSQFGSITEQSNRIGYYFSIFDIILFSFVAKYYKKKTMYLFFFLYALFIFCYDYYYLGRSEIFPYKIFC